MKEMNSKFSFQRMKSEVTLIFSVKNCPPKKSIFSFLFIFLVFGNFTILTPNKLFIPQMTLSLQFSFKKAQSQKFLEDLPKSISTFKKIYFLQVSVPEQKIK